MLVSANFENTTDYQYIHFLFIKKSTNLLYITTYQFSHNTINKRRQKQ